MKNHFIFIGTITFGLVILSACSSQPTLGEQMINQSSGTKELGKQWSKANEKIETGDELIKQGNEMIEDARKNMREGEDKVIEGKKLVVEGKLQMEESEKVYKNRFPRAYERIQKNP